MAEHDKASAIERPSVSASALPPEIGHVRQRHADPDATQAGDTGGAAPESPSAQRRNLAEFATFAVESMSDGVYLITREAKIVYVNKAACRQLGYTREELLQLCIFDINPTLTAEVWDAVWGVTVSDKVQTIEVEHRSKDGRIVPVEILANYLEIDGEQFSCSFTRDISVRREMEARLRQSEKMEAIGQLAGGIAHDFNNQMSAMLGFAEMLRMELADRPQLKHDVDAIISAIGRSSALTAQLLAFARQGKYKAVPVNLHTLIEEAVRMLERSINKNITIISRLEPVDVTTIGDPAQLENALLNLGINARDAMPLGGELVFSTRIVELDKKFCARRHCEIAPGTYVKVCVSDSGIGMSKEVQARLFEPFFTTKEPGKGTGMGLAAVYGTIKNHKGAIEVQTQPGKGAVFTIYLPCLAIKAASNRSVYRPDSRKHFQARVLLVDDEPLVRESAKGMLEHLGCKVITAINGVEAVDLYTTSFSQFDMVILDVVLPEMGGKEVFLRMRDINPELIVVIASGNCSESEIQEFIRGGARGFLQKPYDLKELTMTLSTIVGS